MPHFLLAVMWLWGFTPGFAIVGLKYKHEHSSCGTTHDRHSKAAMWSSRRLHTNVVRASSATESAGLFSPWQDKVTALVSASKHIVTDKANTHPASMVWICRFLSLLIPWSFKFPRLPDPHFFFFGKKKFRKENLATFFADKHLRHYAVSMQWSLLWSDLFMVTL